MENVPSNGNPDLVVKNALPRGRMALAISGGLDSMCLLEACARAFPSRRARAKRFLVATFDHRTGLFAANASAFVASRAAELGFSCVVGFAAAKWSREHEWRAERWRFLREVARRENSSVVTAHTRDDQIETIFMRVLREAGPRGLAGLFAESDIIRPFISTSRSELVAYAGANGVRHLEDPTNESRAHLRNRVRHDLLPALKLVRPSIASALLSIGRRSAEWRKQMDSLLMELAPDQPENGQLRVARATLKSYDANSLCVIWPVLAARASVVMDRRGTHRAAEFTINGMTGGSIQLSGGVEILMRRDHLLLRRWQPQK